MRHAYPKRLMLAALLLSAASAGTRAAYGQESILVATLGKDTVAVDAYSESDSGVAGRLLLRFPSVRVASYSFVRRAGGLGRFFVEWRSAAGQPLGAPFTSAEVIFEGDSATATVSRNDSTIRRRVAATTSAIPVVDFSAYWHFVEAARRHRKAGSDSSAFQWLVPSIPGVLNARARSEGDATVELTYFNGPMLVRFDGATGVPVLSGERSTTQVRVSSAAGADFDAMARHFAAQEVGGGAFGVLSPAGTSTAAIADATLSVQYGRPSKRGRQIFGALVPWGEVWRTGANAATHFSTSRDLRFGEKTLPAGTYTLWSKYTAAAGDTLIISRQVDIWGTQYDPAQDVMRLPMQRSTNAAPVEQFTIQLQAAGARRGTLILSWDSSSFRVPFEVR